MKDQPSGKARCGLCGKTKNLMKTDCCGNWICNDHHKYVLFSYARSSCARNHHRLTLCGFHYTEGHKGHWKDCKACRDAFQTEMYVWYGTNQYNFEVLENPPEYEPTLCDECGVVIKLGTDGYSIGPMGTQCEMCSDLERDELSHPKKRKRPVARSSPAQLPANSNPNAIEIILSAKAQQRWHIKPAVRASEPPLHWLGQWRVDFGSRWDRTQVALATNSATLYTFVFAMKELGRGARFEELFRLRLSRALQDAPSLAQWMQAPIVFAAGNPRMVVGSMNDMRKHVAWAPAELGHNEEEMINTTPFLSLKESFPDRAFARRLAETGAK